MDDIVIQSLIRWPNVPVVYGWLKLDCRGRWLIKGAPVTNETMKAYIGRNYSSDENGDWYFQNGPQKVFVELEYTPYICRLWHDNEGKLIAETHTNLPIQKPLSFWLDETGNILNESEHGISYVEPNSLDILLNSFVTSEGDKASDNLIEKMLGGNAQVGKSIIVKWNDLFIPVQFLSFEKFPEKFSFNPFPLPSSENSL